MEKKRNLVFVTVDCLRADHVGFYGYDVSTTPFLDTLANDSTVYDRAIVAGLPTYHSFPAILASRMPFDYGRGALGLLPEEETLAAALRGAGWKTAAFVAGNPYLTRRFNYDRGFDRFEAFLNSSGPIDKGVESQGSALRRGLEKQADRWGWTSRLFREVYFRYGLWRASSGTVEEKRRYPSAKSIVDDALGWLRGNPDGTPYFLWLHLMDPHHPYFPSPEALEAIGRADLARTATAVRLNAWWNRDDLSLKARKQMLPDVTALYDAGIRWADIQIERLVDSLRSMGSWGDTLFVLTSDHGEEFLEQGSWYHYPANLGEHLIHVPLMMHGADSHPERRPSPFSLRELPSLILQKLGISRPSSWSSHEGDSPYVLTECVSDCRNPLPLENRLAPRLIASQNGTHKLVIDFRSGKELFFDVEEGRDRPLEHTEISKKKRAEMYASVLDHVLAHKGGHYRAVRLEERLARIRRSLIT